MFELAPFGLPAGYGNSILPLADAKAHLAIAAEETEFDDLIEAFRDAAVQMVEQYCGVILAPRTGADALVWRAEALPSRVRLGLRPVTAVTAIGYLDGNGVEQALSPASVRLGLGGEVLPVVGASWPTGNGFSITFEGGFTDAERPPALAQAVRMFMAHLFLHREAVVATGSAGGEVPFGFRALCSPFRPVLI